MENIQPYCFPNISAIKAQIFIDKIKGHTIVIHYQQYVQIRNVSILNQNVSTVDTFWYNLPKKWGRLSNNLELKIKKNQFSQNFSILKIQQLFNEYKGEEKNSLLHL